jgi:hypothetical protein
LQREFFTVTLTTRKALPVVATLASAGQAAASGDADVVVALGLVGLIGLYAAWGRVRGTTATAAWCWAGVSLGCIVVAELAVAWLGRSMSPAAVESCRFAAAATTFCPVMSLLGSRRPHYWAWQFIVLSLWCVLVLPGGEALVFGRGGLEVDVVRSWFLLILVVVALLNSLPTRSSLSGILLAGGQLLMLWRFLPLPAVTWRESTPVWGFGLVVAGGVLFAYRWPRAPQAAEPLDRAWRDFRDLFGAAWALRIAQRINASSAMYGWGVTLAWHGFENSASSAGRPGTSIELRPELRQAIENNLATLLRRFVSSEWLAARLGSSGHVPVE